MKHNTLQKLFFLYQREEENIQVSLWAYPSKADHGLDKTHEVDRSLGNLVDGCLITASYGSVFFQVFLTVHWHSFIAKVKRCTLREIKLLTTGVSITFPLCLVRRVKAKHKPKGLFGSYESTVNMYKLWQW